MMKKTLVVSLWLLAALALADGLLLGSSGKGRLDTADGRTGSFTYDVSKRIASNGKATFAGKLRFEQQPNTAGPYALIEMGVPSTLTENGNVCEFSGHGILTALVDGKRVQFGGTVSVRVSDRHDPATSAGDPDTFRIRFLGEKGLTFSSEGLLTSGDLIVTSKTVK